MIMNNDIPKKMLYTLNHIWFRSQGYLYIQCPICRCPLPLSRSLSLQSSCSKLGISIHLTSLPSIHPSRHRSHTARESQDPNHSKHNRTEAPRDVSTDPLTSQQSRQHNSSTSTNISTSSITINTSQTITDPSDAQQRHQTAHTPANTTKDRSPQSHHYSPAQQQYTAGTSSPSSS